MKIGSGVMSIMTGGVYGSRRSGAAVPGRRSGHGRPTAWVGRCLYSRPVNAEFNWWLLIVGLVIGAGLVWLVLADSRRREVDILERRARRRGPLDRRRPWPTPGGRSMPTTSSRSCASTPTTSRPARPTRSSPRTRHAGERRGDGPPDRRDRRRRQRGRLSVRGRGACQPVPTRTGSPGAPASGEIDERHAEPGLRGPRPASSATSPTQ